MTITRGTTPTLTVRLRHTKTRELIDLERLRLGEAWVSFGKPGSTVLTFSASDRRAAAGWRYLRRGIPDLMEEYA